MAIICHCNVVRERTIERAIRRGAIDLDELRDACGAGGSCGGCEPMLLELLDEHAAVPATAVRIAV